MPRVLLALDADPSALKRAFGEIRAESRSVSAAIAGDFRKAGDEAVKALGLVRREAGRAMTEVTASERRRTEATERQSQRRRQISETEGSYRENVERKATSVTETQERRRTEATDRESKRRVSIEDRAAREIARARTRATERAERRGRQFGGQVFDAAVQTGSQVMGAVRGERSRFASTERAIGSALYQAGGTRADVVATTRQVQDFARAHPGLDSNQIANALNAAQTEFSVLGNATPNERPEARRARLESGVRDSLDTALLARNINSDPGELMRLSGLLSQNGITGAMQRGSLLGLAGLAQRGSLELGSVTREAMPAFAGRLALAQSRLAPNATHAQRVAAGQEAALQAMSEMEFMRSQGLSANRSGNSMLAMSTALTSDVTQHKALANIRRSFGRDSAAERALFESDPAHRGQMRLRAGMTDVEGFVRAFGAATGNNRELFENTFAGGGHGNPMAFQRNWRTSAATFLSRDANGQLGLDRTAEMRRGAALTEERVNAGAEIFQNDGAAREQARQEERGAALTDNTSAIVRLTEKLDSAAAEHPFLAPGAGLAGGLLARAGMERLGARLGGAVLPRAAALLGQGVGASAGTTAGVTVGGLLAGLGVGELANRFIYNRQDRAMSASGGDTSIFSRKTWSGAGQGLVDMLRGDLHGGGRNTFDPAAIQRAVSDGVEQGIRQSGGVPLRANLHESAADAARRAAGSTPPR